ncbi:hypothetical protein N7520_006786 [Penicillium odoratum]|uniref:uncharacterized protein n=1 Tax=Penicillium odoratum TaxID=1167516 RepID=UPI0025495009|nr:uncharacterized protein N7520_006786 [Penicillium odoratum]KAJ5759630.1 hypothetical protein N7520_006786 [Penicillium odoratum]
MSSQCCAAFVEGFTVVEEYSVMENATGGRVCFQQYLQSEDRSIRQWAENARDSFNDIRNSPDPLLRKYYDDLRQARLVSSSKTWQGKKVDRLKQYLSGTNKKVQKSKLDLKDGDEVFFQLRLNELTHPRAYAQVARPSDPASRLAASISNSDRVRGGFHVFLQTKGSLNVKKMNSLVDALEGYSLEESRSFIGRWHTKKSTSHGEQARVHVYT